MIAHVITIMDMPQSVEIAERCIASGAEFGVEVKHFPAVTPKDDPEKLMTERGFPFKDGRIWGRGSTGKTAFSKRDPCLSCFLSHSALWARAFNEQEPFLILEHDAVFRSALPPESKFSGICVCNLGRPSFGTFNVPAHGIGPLTSKDYFPGAHAYVVTRGGAKELLRSARKWTAPTDVFLHTRRFPWLAECYPWPIVCDDSFSTIQLEVGCRPKHNKVVPI